MLVGAACHDVRVDPRGGIRRVRADEWEALRDLRLRALADAPRAFSTTLAEARRRDEAWWREAAARGARGETWATFVAVDGDELVGLASGYDGDENVRAPSDAPYASLMQMWVDPRHRRHGLARALANAVVAWARDRGIGRVRLHVVLSETGAVALYRSLGFRDTGHRERVRDDRDDVEMEMERTTVLD